MQCGCCGQEARDMGKKTVGGEDMYICDPCKPTEGLCRVGYHIFNKTTIPPKAEMPPMVTKKGRGKR